MRTIAVAGALTATMLASCSSSDRTDLFGGGLGPGTGEGATGADPGQTEGTGGGPGSGGAGDPDTGGTGDGGDGGDGDGGIKFDTPNGGDGNGGDGEAGCQKVDFLFVVDNSGSMSDNQQNLITSFPGFMQTISETLEAQDFHVMAIDTDTWPNTNGGGGAIACSPHPSCCQGICSPGAFCNGTQCPTPPAPPTPCDAELGAGRTIDMSYQPCPITGPHRYMLDSQPDLEGTFACVARVGIDGSGTERPMEAMMRSVSDAFVDPGGCNEGFVRDDAILVVTIITDEEDDADESIGDPAQWKQALVDAKGGDENAVVVLGLVPDDGLPGAICTDEEEAPRLHEFLGLVDRVVVGSVCEPDYTPFFVSAVSTIDAACEDFVPPG